MSDEGNNPKNLPVAVPEKPKAKPRRTSKKKTKKKAPRKPTPQQIADCMDFRSQGYSHEAIAQEVGLEPHEVVAVIEQKANEIYVEPKRVALLIELERVNQYLIKQHDAAINGETDAVNAVTNLTRRRLEVIKELTELGGNDDNELSLRALPYAFAGIPRPAPTGKPKSRRGHQVTERLTAQVEILCIAGASNNTIAKMLHIDTDTLVKHYAEVMENARPRFIGEMLLLHAQRARRGDSNAQQFFLRTMGGTSLGMGGAGAASGGENGALPPPKTPGAEPDRAPRIVVVGGLPDPEQPRWEDELPDLEEPEPLPDKKPEPAPAAPLKAVQ